jgi:hypothetical protein
MRLIVLHDGYEVAKDTASLTAFGWFSLLSRFVNGCRVPLDTTGKIGNGKSPV